MKAVPNPLVEAFRNQGHGWAGPLLEVLEDFEIRLQMLESEPGGPASKSSGRVTPAFVNKPASKRSGAKKSSR